MNMKKLIIPASVVLLLVLASCQDLLESVLPSNQTTKEDAIKTPEDLQELLNAAYDVLANANNGNNQRFSELLTDNVNMVGNSGFLVQVFTRSSDFFNSDVGSYYNEQYRPILRANAVLENMGALGLSEAEADRFEGEARFIRAISHFELVRLFAQPYGYTPDNSHLGIVIKTSTTIEPLQRSTVQQVYELIISDLEAAEELLPTENGNYATSYSAKAYLAKVYFQMNDFENAAENAEEVIPNFAFSTDINNRYTDEVSSESVFTIISTSINDNRGSLLRDSYRSINPDPSQDPDNTAGIGSPTIRVSQEYYNFMTSSGTDLRADWVAEKTYSNGEAYVLTKFDSAWFNVTLASVTELMLIAAESYGELGTNLAVAEDYLNDIKDRADVPVLSGVSAATIITEARIERRKEFGGEGNRLHELKRIGVLGEDVIVRGAPWDCNGMVLQFPASERSIKGFIANPQGGCN
jgi:starch-binding outer membrane protein, SusD/RagB family